ncbi:MAG: hypothetical protein PHX14_00955 [Syntrophomonadaceae bacterium]|nr:hypothetical protein [Syntrophomonadaceae bacterium]
MSNENVLITLKATGKKISDLRGFNIPIILEIIDECEQAGADQYFIDQLKLQLQKYQLMVDELEAKFERLINRLE